AGLLRTAAVSTRRSAMSRRMLGLTIAANVAGVALAVLVAGVVAFRVAPRAPDSPPAAQAVPAAPGQVAAGQVAEARNCSFSGPYTHDNLALFLIHGPDTLRGPAPLTLQEALAQN